MMLAFLLSPIYLTLPLSSTQVIVTTYQTLNGDFSTPKDVDPTEEAQWLAGNGSVFFHCNK